MTLDLGKIGIPLGSYEEGSGGATVDCYSKEETDNLLDGKQNKLNISAPIQISKLSSVPDNISVASDGTTMYLNYSAYTVPYPYTDTFRYMGGSSQSTFSLSKGTYESGNFVFKDGKHGKAMQINLSGYFHYLHNFKIGDVVKFTYGIPCVIGHLDSDNYFEPYIVLHYSGETSSWARIHTNINGYSLTNSSFTFNNSVNIGQKYGYQSYAFSNQSIRFVEDDNGKIKIQACAYKTHTNGNGFYGWDDITLDDTYDVAGLNCILFGNEPWSSAQEPPVSSLSSKNKIYPDTQSIFYAATFADAENPTPIVVPGNIAEIETLNLAIDSNTLSVVDNKLTVVGGARIDDQKISESTTWSSNKINTAVTEVSADVSTLNNVVGNHTTSISAINDSIGVINNTMVTKNQMNALEERVTTLEAQAGGAAPTVTFSNEGAIEKAGAVTSSNILQSEDIGSVIFDISGSAEIK